MMPETKIAIEAATCAGAYLRSVFGHPTEVRLKGDTSFVSAADLEASRIIREKLQNAFSSYAILDEEMENAKTYTILKQPTWVIDPLDGTSNFLGQLPIFAVAIALVKDHETVLGVIFDPIHNELFVAERGKGTTLNGEPVTVSARHGAKGGMLFAGRGYKKRDRERHGKIIYDLEQQTNYFRRLGCATLMLSNVACGRADSVILTGSQPWDILAGALMVQESGGLVTNYCGKPWTLDSNDLLASNGAIHEDILLITKETDHTCL